VRPPLLLILLVGTGLVAQSAKPATLVASIVDKHGDAVSLRAEAKIYISEDGKQTQASAAQKLTGPVLYVVMLDSSSSADDTPMRQVVKELPNFFQRALRPQDKVTVIGFSEQATTEIEPTNDVETIRRALSSLRWSGRTALFDSVIQVCTRTIPKMTLPDGRVAVILLTDGEDSASRAHEDAALKAAEASHAVFYPIDIRFGLKMWAGEFVQQDFANETGGKFFQFASTKDLQNALQEIQNLIGSEYRIEFAAKPDSDSKAGLKVKVEGQSDLRVIAPKHLSE
jgi:Ca-activated chloride channel homolog